MGLKVAYGVPTLPFLKEGNFKLLKEEIETFNPIGIQGLPKWILSSIKRHDPRTRFGFIGDRYSTRACRFYAVTHLSKDYSCSIYNTIGKPCKHTTPLCINYKEK